jgi:hypothetical protein
MASDDPAGTRPAPVVLRIKLRYDSVDAMTERFAPHVGRSGLFLPTRSLQAIGTEVKFELRLATDQPVLVGLGRVTSMKEPDPRDPAAAYGLGIELMRVTRESRELILKLLARRKQLGLPEVALPRAEEIDAARQAVAEASGVPQPIGVSPVLESRPVAAVPVAAPVVESRPIAAAPSAIPPLPAEPPRKKRRPVSEVIEAASGPIAASLAIPGLDEDVDVGKALARARALATGDLDQELEQLRDQVAAPLAEISVEEASVELARQLGGAAVRRTRSQGWAPPPPAVVVEAEAKPAPAPAVVEAAAVVEAEAEAKAAAAAVVEAEAAAEAKAAEEAAPAPAPAAAPEPAAADVHVAPGRGIIERDEEDAAHLRSDVRRRAFTPPGVDQILTEPAAAIAPAGREPGARHPFEDDDDESEHTHIGGPLGESSGFDQTLLLAGEPDALGEPAEVPAAAATADVAATADPEEESGEQVEEIEEIEEFEILAEADAADADLLAAYGEADLAAAPEIPQPAVAHHAPSDHDFASRLEFDDDFYSPPPGPPPSAPLTLDPRELSVDAALGALDRADEPVDFDEPHAGAIPAPYPRYGSHSGYLAAQPPRDPADEFSSHHVDISPPPDLDPRDGLAPSPELETALGALDVDLDALAHSHGGPGPRRGAARGTGSGRAVRPAVGTTPGRAPRAPTDGIVIDFDDDDDDQ